MLLDICKSRTWDIWEDWNLCRVHKPLAEWEAQEYNFTNKDSMHLQTFMSLYRSWSVFMIDGCSSKVRLSSSENFLKTIGTTLRWNVWPKSEVRLMAKFSSHPYYLPTRLPCPIAGVLKGWESPFLKTLLHCLRRTLLSHPNLSQYPLLWGLLLWWSHTYH